MQFTFRGNNIALNAVSTSKELIDALMHSNQGCPIDTNPKIHFGKFLGEGAAGAPVVEVTVEGYGKRIFAVKNFKVPVKTEFSNGDQTFDEITNYYAKYEGASKELMNKINPKLVGTRPKRGARYCIPYPIYGCKTTTQEKYERYESSGFTVVPAGSYLCDNELYSEYYIGLLCGRLVTGFKNGGSTYKCINFIDVFGFTTCYAKCTVNQYIFMEKIDGSIRKLGNKKKLTKPQLDSLYVQFILAVSFMQYVLKVSHNDLHCDNMFLQFITPETEYNGEKLYDAKYLRYDVGGTSVYVPNEGVLLKIGDYGLSVKYSEPIVGRYEIFEGAWTYYWGTPRIPNWLSLSYDILFGTYDFKIYSELAKEVFDHIQNTLGVFPMDEHGRPILKYLDILDTIASSADILLNPLFSRYFDKPTNGKVVMVGEMIC